MPEPRRFEPPNDDERFGVGGERDDRHDGGAVGVRGHVDPLSRGSFQDLERTIEIVGGDGTSPSMYS